MKIDSDEKKLTEREREGTVATETLDWNRLIMTFTEERGPLEPTRERGTDIKSENIRFYVSCALERKDNGEIQTFTIF